MKGSVPLFSSFDDYIKVLGVPKVAGMKLTDNDDILSDSGKQPELSLNVIISRRALKLVYKDVSAFAFNMQRYHWDECATQPDNPLTNLNHYVQMQLAKAVQLFRRKTFSHQLPREMQVTEYDHVVLNVISNVMHSDLKFNDKIATLHGVRSLASNYAYSQRKFLPIFLNSDMVTYPWLVDLGITVEQFIPSPQTLKLKVDYPTLYSSLESFNLLKDEINKIEEGLFDTLSKLFDNMFKTTDYTDFIDNAVILYGKVKPYHSCTLIEDHQNREQKYREDPDKVAELREDKEKLKTFLDTTPKRKIEEEVEKINTSTLLLKFKLDCNCHIDTDDWKLIAIPQMFYHVFGMVAKEA